MEFSHITAVHHGFLLPLVAEVLDILNKYHFAAKIMWCVLVSMLVI